MRRWRRKTFPGAAAKQQAGRTLDGPFAAAERQGVDGVLVAGDGLAAAGKKIQKRHPGILPLALLQ